MRLPAIIIALVVAISGTLSAPAAIAAELPALTPVPGTSGITGLPRVGKMVTVEPGQWAPTDSEITFTYRWRLNEVRLGAIEQSLLIETGDADDYLDVVVIAKAEGYRPYQFTEGVYLQDAAITGPVPTISGYPSVGETLSYHPQDDGWWRPRPLEFSLQWLSNGKEVPGATGETFVPTSTDIGATISVLVTASQDTYDTVSIESNPTQKVTPQYDAPQPKIVGTARAGSPLTVDTGTWGTPTPAFTYEWLIDGHVVSRESSYEPFGWDLGKRVTVRVVGRSATVGPTAAEESEPTQPIAAGTMRAPQLTLVGTPRVNQELFIKGLSWHPYYASLAFQWYSNGKVIKGATARTYVPQSRDWHTSISVKVRATSAGFASSDATSKAAVVQYGWMPDPDISAPTKARVGDIIKVKATGGQVNGVKPTYVYNWFHLDGPMNSRKNTSSYKVKKSDLGETIVVGVTVKGRGHMRNSYNSQRIQIVGDPFTKSPKPTVSGTARVGSTLKANAHTWKPSTGARFSYQWYYREAGSSHSIKISGATKKTFTATKALKGKVLFVAVTGRKSGYETTTQRSVLSSPVLPK